MSRLAWPAAAVVALASCVGLSAAGKLPVTGYTVTPSPDWIPSTPCTEMQPGSALDFSRFGFTEGPCGKFGWLVAKGENFEFEKRPGKPVRFMGVNFCCEGNVLPKDESKRLIRNLVRLGYNTVRVHHHDDYLIRRSGSYTELDPEAMDRFDAMMAACRENGVYVTTDLAVSRRMSWRSVGIARDGLCSDFRTLIHFHDGAKSNYLAFARNFLNHRNPYTGLRYAEDPTLAWLSLVNEGNLWNNDVGPLKRHAELVLPKWRAWLQAKRAKDPAYNRVPDTLPDAVLEIPKDNRVVAFTEDVKSNAETFSPTAHVIAFQQFLVSRHWEFYREMRRIIRDELGSRALLTDNNGWMFVPSDKLLRDRYDFVDDHFYYGHPAFLGPHWSLPARIFDQYPINIRKWEEFGVPYKAGARLFNHPFTISEYNYAPPMPSRAAGAFLLGANAALQNWAAVWRFCWTCNAAGAVDAAKKSLNHFDIAGDPCVLATEKAIACLYLRRDLPELTDIYPNLHRPSQLRSLEPFAEDAAYRHPSWMAYRAKIGNLVAEERPACAAGPETLGDAAGTVDGAVRVNRRDGWIMVDTPRTTGGFVDHPSVVSTAQLSAEVSASNTSVWASSLDMKPIAESRRLLFALASDVQNPGIEYEDASMAVLIRWGRQDRGRLSRRVVAKTALKVAPGEWKAYALRPDGSRKREIAASYGDGALRFTADIAGDPNEAEMYYELTRPEERQ